MEDRNMRSICMALGIILIPSLSPGAGGAAPVCIAKKKLTPTIVESMLGRVYVEPTTGMELVFIKGGCYQMGDTFGNGDSDEQPVHEVCVDDFYLGKYEVTVGQFRQFVQDTGYRTEAEKGNGCFIWSGATWEKQVGTSWRAPGFSQQNDHPVTCTTWNDTLAFTTWLFRKSGKSYRLPTEAEWEFAARSGGKIKKYTETSNGNGVLGHYAWYGSNSVGFTHPVGQKQPNALGLYDMLGNVWEWCQDWYGEGYYGESPQNNPQGPFRGLYRVLRGGSGVNLPRFVRAVCRDRGSPAHRSSGGGFRLAMPAR